MRVRLWVTIVAMAALAASVSSCSDVVQPKEDFLVARHYPADKVYIYIPEYSNVECSGAHEWQWVEGQWTEVMVTRCYQVRSGGGYAYIGTGHQPQINSYCRDDAFEEYCYWRDDPPSGDGSAGPGPSEWQNLTIPMGVMDNDEMITPTPQGPNCPPPQDQNYQKNLAWCNGQPPPEGSKAYQRILDALDAMYKKGGICQQMALDLTQIVIRGELHVFPTGAAGPGVGGFSPNGAGETGYVGIADTWTKFAYDNNHKTKPAPSSNEPPLSLQNILAHEADHLTNSFVHPVGSPGWQTPNTLTCGS